MLHDRHVLKMALEAAQMLSTAWHDLNSEHVPYDTETGNFYLNGKPIYRMSFIYHPCSIWVRESKDHYVWLFKHARAICEEYWYRWGEERGHRHAVGDVLDALGRLPPSIPKKGFTEPPKCMPDEYKQAPSVIDAYRVYYLGRKIEGNIYTRREEPSWVSEYKSSSTEHPEQAKPL